MSRARSAIAALAAAALLALGKVARHAEEAGALLRLPATHAHSEDLPRLEPADALGAAEQAAGGASDQSD